MKKTDTAETTGELTATERSFVKKSERSPPPHGTRRRYNRPWRCRCDGCRAANTEHHRHLRAAYRVRLTADPTIVTHGLRSTYGNYGCRCEACTAANTTFCATWAEARKTATKEKPPQES